MLSYEEFEWEFKKALEEKYPDAKIILLTTFLDDEYVREQMRELKRQLMVLSLEKPVE